jgi:ATP-binding cassette subfamily F protein 3
MEEASKAFGEILNGFDMKSTSNWHCIDYESDAYMKLIERVSDLSEKFY